MNGWKDPRATVVVLLVLVLLVPVIAASFMEQLPREEPEYVYDVWRETLIAVIAVIAAYVGSRKD